MAHRGQILYQKNTLDKLFIADLGEGFLHVYDDGLWLDIERAIPLQPRAHDQTK